jgi:hypothetical protein
MSELIEQKNNRAIARWQLLASVSALALVANAASQAHAEDTDGPTVWIELGGQLERQSGGFEPFTPPFVSHIDTTAFTPPSAAQRPPRYATGFEGKLLIEPQGPDWVLSAAIRYGRSNRSSRLHEETKPPSPYFLESIPAFDLYVNRPETPAARRFVDSNATTKSSHLVLDFQVGKDVGLGLFGKGGSSTIGVGVRFAQFSSKTDVTLDADPNFSISYKYSTTAFNYFTGRFNVPQQSWDLYTSKGKILRSFHGIGPSANWDASVPVLGHEDGGEISVDWGANVAVLFGRQKVLAKHNTGQINHYPSGLQTRTSTPTTHHYTYPHSRSVIVPNVGGFAGLSLKFPNVKVSLGYRADIFFGAMDGGVDTRKTYDRAFYGPFASFSVGLGG